MSLPAELATIFGLFRAGFERGRLAHAYLVVGAPRGEGGAFALRLMFPTLPAYAPAWAVIAALGTALVTGLLFGVMPANRPSISLQSLPAPLASDRFFDRALVGMAESGPWTCGLEEAGFR